MYTAVPTILDISIFFCNCPRGHFLLLTTKATTFVSILPILSTSGCNTTNELRRRILGVWHIVRLTRPQVIDWSVVLTNGMAKRQTDGPV